MAFIKQTQQPGVCHLRHNLSLTSEVHFSPLCVCLYTTIETNGRGHDKCGRQMLSWIDYDYKSTGGVTVCQGNVVVEKI